VASTASASDLFYAMATASARDIFSRTNAATNCISWADQYCTPSFFAPILGISRNFRASNTTLIRKKDRGTFSIKHCFKVVILSHIPFLLPGFEIQQATRVEGTLTITAVSTSQTAICPSCGKTSKRLHSYYMRSPHDLPSSGLSVHLQLSVRRFRGQNEDCPRQTFVERLPELVAVSAQRTVRLTRLLYAFSLTLSGEAGARLLSDIGVLTSPDTLLRLVKGGQVPITKTPRAIGVDDFALRRGQTYGTIIIDLSTHRPIDLLTERTAEPLSQWLVEHPGIEFISRDRSSEYMRGATEGAPQAQQVLDRWHVLKNVREGVQRIVSRNHARLKQRQKDAGVIVRARYKKKRSSSEIAAS
jgi:transposase